MIRILIVCFIGLIVNHYSLNGQEVATLTDLPLECSLSYGTHDELVIYITGDGGWNSFNGQMVHQIEKNGYGVVALNSRKYFWNEKSPEIFSADIERIATNFLKSWKKSSVIIIGYSFGADVASFLPGHLPVSLKNRIKLIGLISPSASTDFVIRLSDLVGENENLNRRYKVKPELIQIGIPVVCTFGSDERKVLKDELKASKNLAVIELPGDHRYSNNFSLLIKTFGI